MSTAIYIFACIGFIVVLVLVGLIGGAAIAYFCGDVETRVTCEITGNFCVHEDDDRIDCEDCAVCKKYFELLDTFAEDTDKTL